MTELDQVLQPRRSPATEGRPRLNTADVRHAYGRWASVYDLAFGLIFSAGRHQAVAIANAFPGRDILDVGVGTGLSLPQYNKEKRVTGVDLSPAMLDRARLRTRRSQLTHVQALIEADAQSTGLDTNSFDVAVAMFVASVAPDPRRLLTELKRVVRPGGMLVFVNHYMADDGIRRPFERLLAKASRRLGWHPDFSMTDIFSSYDLTRINRRPVFPFGLFTLVELVNEKRL